jgi:hypothetical protein
LSKIPDRPIGFRLAHELDGLLQGIAADGIITAEEIARLQRWMEANASYRHIHPFSELAERVDRAMGDGRLDSDECADLLFVVSKLTTVNPHFDQLRGGVQVLMGHLAGLCADHVLTDSEVRSLSDWVSSWSHLKGLWPYDECESIVATALKDGRVDDEEVSYLFALSRQFPVAGEVTLSGDVPPLLVNGICALAPVIEFGDRDFVFTGESARGPREELESIVMKRDGRAAKNVTKMTDYLVVCDGGCPHWAFSCYGRKVEKAYNLRREGHPILIVHEFDFWRAESALAM